MVYFLKMSDYLFPLQQKFFKIQSNVYIENVQLMQKK